MNHAHKVLCIVVSATIIFAVHGAELSLSQTKAKIIQPEDAPYQPLFTAVPEKVQNLTAAICLAAYYKGHTEKVPFDIPSSYNIHGPSGVGKSNMIYHISQQTDAPLIRIPFRDLMLAITKYKRPAHHLESELKKILTSALRAAQTSVNRHAIIWIEDYLESKSKELSDFQLELLTKRLPEKIAELNATQRDSIFLFAETKNAITPAARITPFFHPIHLPRSDDRDLPLTMLFHFLKLPYTLKRTERDEIESALFKTTPSECKAIAAIASLRACKEHCDDPWVTYAHLIPAIKEIIPKDIDPKPSEEPHIAELPTQKTTFADIAGTVDASIIDLTENIRDRANFLAFGLNPPKGILLVGPPGTGKTLLARAIAGELDCGFFNIAGSQFSKDKWIGTGGTVIRELFEQAQEYVDTNHKPAIIFIDEIDAVGAARGSHDPTHPQSSILEHNRVVTELLNQLDGFEKNPDIIIIGTTNRVEILDAALIRSGRFSTIIEIGLPNSEKREAILKLYALKIQDKMAEHAYVHELSEWPRINEMVNFAYLATESEGLNCADLEDIVLKAVNLARRARAYDINQSFFEAALTEKKIERASQITDPYSQKMSAEVQSMFA